MLQPVRVPIVRVTNGLDQTTSFDNTVAVVFALRNGVWRHIPQADHTATLFNAALGNGASAGIVTVSANKNPVLSNICASVATAGRYQFVYGAVVFADFRLPINGSILFTYEPYGLFFSVQNATFALVNLTGGAADVSVSIAYAEVDA